MTMHDDGKTEEGEHVDARQNTQKQEMLVNESLLI